MKYSVNKPIPPRKKKVPNIFFQIQHQHYNSTFKEK